MPMECAPRCPASVLRRSTYISTMRSKLGLLLLEEEADIELVEGLLTTMAETGADFTNTFRRLALVPMPTAGQSGQVPESMQLDHDPLTQGRGSGGTGLGPAPDCHLPGAGKASCSCDVGAFLEVQLPDLPSPQFMAKACQSR